MICPKCGRVNPEGVQCPCGAPLLSSNPTVNVIKTLGSSGRFLAVAVLYTVAMVASILASLNMDSVFSAMYYYGANSDLDLYPLIETLENSSVVATVLGSVPTILVALGLWLFYATCRNRENGNISTVGLTIIKVITWIALVVLAICCLVLLLGIIFLFANLAMLSASLYSGGYIDQATASVIVGVIIALFVVVLVVLGLCLGVYACVIKTINRVKASAINGTPDNRVSRYLTVLLMVFGVIGGIGGVIALFGTPVASVSGLAGAVCSILVSLLLGNYRTQMTMLLYPPVQPTYPQPPVPPQP